MILPLDMKSSSVNCSMMLHRVKIWSMHPCPFRKPAWSWLSLWSTPSEICLMMSLARIFLGTGRRVTLLQLLQLLRTPFFEIFTMAPSVQSSGSCFSSHIAAEWLKNSCCKLWKSSALKLSSPRAFPCLSDLMIAMISSFFLCWCGAHILVSIRICTSASIVNGCCSELHWNALPIFPPALFLWCLPCLLTISMSLAPQYLPLMSLVILYICPCPLLLAASSAWLATCSMWACLSALFIVFTNQSASQYCCLYLSFSLSDLVSMTFFFRVLLLPMACQVSAVIHSLLFFVPGRPQWSVYRLLLCAPTWCWCHSCWVVHVFQHLPVLETCSSVGVRRYSLL